jgi:hypothetical protein
MSIPADVRARLLQETREAGAAFVEDMKHVRDVVIRQDTSRADLRRLSGVLRRLLVERDIARIASPRLGRRNFGVPDNSAFHKITDNPFSFFGSGGANIFGVNARALVAFNGNVNWPRRNRGRTDRWPSVAGGTLFQK